MDSHSQAISAVIGGTLAADLNGVITGAIAGWTWIQRHIAKIVDLVLAKLKALFGSNTVDAIVTKLEKFVDTLDIGQVIFDFATRRDDVEATVASKLPALPDADARATKVEALKDGHADVSKWIGRGTAAVGFVDSFLMATLPWGPPVFAALWAGLMGSAYFVTTDFLDSPDRQAWQLVRGVVHIVEDAS